MSSLSDIFGRNPKEPQRKDIKRKPVVQTKKFRRNNGLDSQVIGQDARNEHQQLIDFNEELHDIQSGETE